MSLYYYEDSFGLEEPLKWSWELPGLPQPYSENYCPARKKRSSL